MDGSIPMPFSFSIAYYPSHIDPYSDYAIRAYHLLHSGNYTARYLEGETPIGLNPDNPSSHVEVEVHHGQWIS